MQVEDSVSVLTFQYRVAGVGYYAQPIKFGTSDAVALIGVHYTIEQITSTGQRFIAFALSRNPEHEVTPPPDIAAFFSDEALYARALFALVWADATGLSALSLTKVVPLYGLVVPTRQIMTYMVTQSGSTGLVAEIYYQNVKMSSKAEAALLNLTWGKYRR